MAPKARAVPVTSAHPNEVEIKLQACLSPVKRTAQKVHNVFERDKRATDAARRPRVPTGLDAEDYAHDLAIIQRRKETRIKGFAEVLVTTLAMTAADLAYAKTYLLASTSRYLSSHLGNIPILGDMLLIGTAAGVLTTLAEGLGIHNARTAEKRLYEMVNAEHDAYKNGVPGSKPGINETKVNHLYNLAMDRHSKHRQEEREQIRKDEERKQARAYNAGALTNLSLAFLGVAGLSGIGAIVTYFGVLPGNAIAFEAFGAISALGVSGWMVTVLIAGLHNLYGKKEVSKERTASEDQASSVPSAVPASGPNVFAPGRPTSPNVIKPRA